ncbi:MAG: MtrB/PioB family decaheme-associated outer membrane protein [Gammaproteobacteria bacterium]|nr:MtrB/PioB family decaheme-associated outer membrane protein [Gammaproteobacteria bacterium]
MLYAPGATADDPVDIHGNAEFGAATVNVDHANSRFGEYTGLEDDDAYPVANAEGSVERGSEYFRFHAIDLGLDSRRLDLSAGQYGVYSLQYRHDEIPHLISRDDRTPFDGAGSARLTLPDAFVPAATTAAMGGLEESLKTLDLRTDRTLNLFRASRDFSGGWRAKLSVKREDKNGVQSLAGITAQNPGQVDASILPQPVDYRTDEFSAGLEYAHDGKQIELGYFLSIFHNENSSLTWDVPFLKSAPAALDYPSVARMGLPPDNTYQRVNLSGGMDLPGGARLSVTAEIGQMRQDETLLPYSTDDINGTASLLEDGESLPRSSAEARIDIVHLVLDMAWRPVTSLGVNARYRLYETDNKTPYTLFDRVMNDTVAQSSTEDIYSRPYDFSRSSLELGASYRFVSGVNLKTDYRNEAVDYDGYRAVHDTKEDTLKVNLSKGLGDALSGRVGYLHSQKDAENYDAFLSYSTRLDDVSGCPSVVLVDPDPDTGGSTAVDTCFDNHPDIRQFDIASRERNRAFASISYNPFENFDLGLDVVDSRERYRDNVLFDDTYLGITEDDSLAMTLDAGYSSEEGWSLSTYLTRELISSSQTGREFNATISSAIDSSLNWIADFDDTITTLGIRGGFTLLYETLDITLGYAYSKSESRIRFTAGSALVYEDMPSDGSERHTVDVSAVYRLSDSVALGAGVMYEWYRSLDWALDNVEAGGSALNDVLLLSGPQEDYRAYLLRASMIYSW